MLTIENLKNFARNPLRDEAMIRDLWVRFEAERWFSLVADGRIRLDSLDPGVQKKIHMLKHDLDPAATLMSTLQSMYVKWQETRVNLPAFGLMGFDLNMMWFFG